MATKTTIDGVSLSLVKDLPEFAPAFTIDKFPRVRGHTQTNWRSVPSCHIAHKGHVHQIRAFVIPGLGFDSNYRLYVGTASHGASVESGVMGCDGDQKRGPKFDEHESLVIVRCLYVIAISIQAIPTKSELRTAGRRPNESPMSIQWYYDLVCLLFARPF